MKTPTLRFSLTLPPRVRGILGVAIVILLWAGVLFGTLAFLRREADRLRMPLPTGISVPVLERTAVEEFARRVSVLPVPAPTPTPSPSPTPSPEPTALPEEED